MMLIIHILFWYPRSSVLYRKKELTEKGKLNTQESNYLNQGNELLTYSR